MNKLTIPNIKEYRLQILNGDLILTRIYPFINENLLFQKNLRHSKIKECYINNKKIEDINKYRKLLIYLYAGIDKKIILKNTILNISEEKLYDKGFEYYNNLGLSIQGADSRRILREIINISKINNYKLELKIKLKDNDIICFCI